MLPTRMIPIAAMTFAFAATTGFAEVMDKELSIADVWTWSWLGALIGFFSIQVRWWLGLLTLPFAAAGPLSALAEFHDPLIGPAIAAEAGSHYGSHALQALALALALALHFAGWATSFWRRRKSRP